MDINATKIYSLIDDLGESEPICDGNAQHKWTAPHALVGKDIDNPGNGVIIEVCNLCGVYRSINTLAESPSYRSADDASERFVARTALEMRTDEIWYNEDAEETKLEYIIDDMDDDEICMLAYDVIEASVSKIVVADCTYYRSREDAVSANFSARDAIYSEFTIE